MTSSSLASDWRRVVFGALVAVATGAPPAWAQEAVEPSAPSPSPSQEPPEGEEIIVFGELDVARKRQEVIRDLRALGYQPGKRKDGYTQFRPLDPWKPTVRVYDDGFLVIKRSPVRWQAPGDPNKPLNNLWCLPPFTPMCVRVGGQVVSKRKLQPQKARVAGALEPGMRAWREAISSNAMAERLGVDVPDQLDRLWRNGVGFDGERVPLPEDRRAALLAFWSSRTCTPEGDAVREAVRLYLEYEVQESAHPVTEAERQGAVAACACAADLVLTVSALDDTAGSP